MFVNKKKKVPELSKEQLKEQQNMKQVANFSTRERVLEIDSILRDPIKGKHLKKNELIQALKASFLKYIALNYVSINQFKQLFIQKNELARILMVLAMRSDNHSLKLTLSELDSFKGEGFQLTYLKNEEEDVLEVKFEKIKKK